MSAVWFFLGVLLYMVIGAAVAGVTVAVVLGEYWDEYESMLLAAVWPLTLLMALEVVVYRAAKQAAERLNRK